MNASLLLTGLVRSYGAVAAVAGVSLTVEPGEFVTLLGPSGSGKTSILKMIAGFERPDSGTIHQGTSEITQLEPHLRNIGMVFQNYALFPHMNVFDNIAFPLKMRKWPVANVRNAVTEALAMVQLEGLDRRLPRELSGGQQQRVALARALVFRPPLLLMDEPLGALDHQLRRQVQAQIKRLHQSLGLTVIFVTHDQEEAMFLSDRVAVMQGGRIVQQGSPTDLYARPINRFVASFIGESNLLPGRVTALDGQWADIEIAAGSRQRARAGEGIRVGDAVACLVRPENIVLNFGGSVTSSGAAAGILGEVALASFLGDSMEFEVATALGTFRVRRRVDAQWPAPAPREPVHLTWNPADLLAVADAHAGERK